MLKFENVIRNLSFEEKVTLIISDYLGNRAVSNYDIPVFSVTDEMKDNAVNVVLPTYNDLGHTWNEELVNKFAEQVSLNSTYYKQRTMLGVPTFTTGINSFGECQYLIGKLAAAYIRGIEDGGAFACLNKAPADLDANFLGSEIAFKEGTPSAFISSNENGSRLLDENYYKGLRIATACTPTEVVISIYNGNNLTFVDKLDALGCITDAVASYKRAKDEYLKGQITLADLNTLEKAGKILNEEKIDYALDGLLYNLASYTDRLREEGKIFDTNVLKEVAEESIVLLENNNILPLNTSVKVAIIGEQAVSPILNHNECKLSANATPISFFNKYELNILGHAYGYSNEVKKQDRLVEEALELGMKADVAIVYFGTTSDSLPEKQVTLIKTLHEHNVKIVGVLSGKLDINLSFVDMFDGLIYTGFNTLETIEATVKTILGLVNPSGRLTNRYNYSIDANGKSSFGIRYPLGYGLSYSKFEYSQFKLLHNGIKMTVMNKDKFSGSDVVSLYVSRIENSIEGSKELKAFTKCKLRGEDYQKITLLFDDYTFSGYQDFMCGVLGGVYVLYVCRNENEVLYRTEISLESSFDNKNSFEYEVKEHTNDSDKVINEFVSKSEYYKQNRGMSLGKKVALETVVYAYLLIVSAIIGIFEAENSLLVCIALIAIFTALYVVVLIKSIKKDNAYKKLCSLHPINDMVNTLDSFIVSSKEEFNPVMPEEEIVDDVVVEEPEESEEVQEEVKEEIEITYATCEFELKEDEISYSNDVDFGVLCNNFNEFALKKGLIIEQASIRMLISSVCSSKLVFLRSVRMDLLPKVIKVLNEFLGNDENIFDVTTLENNSLIWETVEEKRVHTAFVKALYQAKKYRKHLNIIALNNVDVDTMNEYFGEYYNYCSNPNVSYNVNFGTENKKELFSLPANLTFIVIPNSYDYIETISKDVAVNSVSLEILVRENELISDNEVVVKRYPYYNYAATIEMEKNHFYLSEESWKKIDDFEESLSMDGSFRVENKTVLQIESFVSALIACGADETEAFDAALATKIAPTVKSYKLYKDGKLSNVIQAALERHFELDLIPLTLRVLKKKD